MKKQIFIKISAGIVVATVLAVGFFAGRQPSRENEDIVAFVKQQEALYLTIPESNNEVLALMNSHTPGVSISDTFLYGLEKGENNTPTAFILARDAQYIINAGKINGEHSVLIPFYVDFGGSGTFLYVGLFSQVEKPHIPNETLRHESSIFVDDRAVLSGISNNSDGSFTISYLTRKGGESFTTEPTVPRTKRIMLVNNTALMETVAVD